MQYLSSRWFLDREMVLLCVICSVASPQSLKRISFAIPLSSSEISTFVEKATAFSWVGFSTAVDISDDGGGMAMDILFKPRVEETEQIAQNCMDISQSKNQRERNITFKWHV